MGASLRLCSGAEAVQKFRRAGWAVARQRGSHVMMIKSGYEYTLSIPQHEELVPRSSQEADSSGRSVCRRV
jgi:predicted RNA binding protein YcfA (HicA-like mRNA interferase family)